MDVTQIVGCGPRSGCINCPPTSEEQRLYFFRCEEVAKEEDGGAAGGGGAAGLAAGAPPPFPGIGMVDSLMPQWDQTGADWEITDEDRRMLAEYEAWLPEKIFDARASYHPPTAYFLNRVRTAQSSARPASQRCLGQLTLAPSVVADAHLWNFEYWSDKVEAYYSWAQGGATGPFGDVGGLDLFKTQMDRFCPGREMGALVLSTPTLAADTLGHSAWSAEECRKTMAESPDSGFFVCAMTTTMDVSHPRSPRPSLMFTS